MIGIWGQPYIDMDPYIDTVSLAEVDQEICFGLTQVSIGYSGGPSSTEVRRAIATFDHHEARAFDSLGNGGQGAGKATSDGELVLSHQQKLYMKFRFGMYYPWKIFYPLTAGVVWESQDAATIFSEEAQTVFPRTLEYLRRLPFKEISGCTILGLESNDYGPVHNDKPQNDDGTLEQWMLICPKRNRRLFILDREAGQIPMRSCACWFNTRDDHCVAPDPHFRYSIRVAGVFSDKLRAQLERDWYWPWRTRSQSAAAWR